MTHNQSIFVVDFFGCWGRLDGVTWVNLPLRTFPASKCARNTKQAKVSYSVFLIFVILWNLFWFHTSSRALECCPPFVSFSFSISTAFWSACKAFALLASLNRDNLNFLIAWEKKKRKLYFPFEFPKNDDKTCVNDLLHIGGVVVYTSQCVEDHGKGNHKWQKEQFWKD